MPTVKIKVFGAGSLSVEFTNSHQILSRLKLYFADVNIPFVEIKRGPKKKILEVKQ